MALLQVNAGCPECPPTLWRAAALLDDHAPIIVMIHGYRFSPHAARHDPHRHILAMDPDHKARHVLSWPRALGFQGNAAEGLAIAFGWEARGSLRRAYDSAAEAARDLGWLIDAVSGIARRPVAIIAHSLGARVALGCLHHVQPGAVNRTVLLAGAEFRTPAAEAVASPAGLAAEVINITSRENDPFDFGMELLLSGGRQQALGLGLAEPRRNWVDVQIDDAATLDALGRLGFPMDAHALRMCHWSPYLRRGVFDLYRTALREPWALPLSVLRTRLPDNIAPRWSRLLGWSQGSGGLRA